MIREAEELERKWREQNAEIMAANPAVPKRRLLRFPTRLRGRPLPPLPTSMTRSRMRAGARVDRSVLAAHAPTEPDQPLSTESAAVPHTDKSA
jgi:hypothetical protein